MSLDSNPSVHITATLQCHPFTKPALWDCVPQLQKLLNQVQDQMSHSRLGPWPSMTNLASLNFSHWFSWVLSCMCTKSLQSCLTLCNPMDCSQSAPLFMGFFRQKYWSGLPCPPPGDVPDPGIESVSPALQVDSLLLST